MPKISGTRVKTGDEAGGSKNMRSGEASNGGPVASPRAQKPVKGSDNAATFKSSASPKATRTGSGYK